MATTHLNDSGLHPNLGAASAARPSRTFLRGMVRTGMRMAVNTGVYLSAAVLGLAVGPALFLLSDRDTAVYWANAILDFVSR
jgi:hypothetical protein